MNKSESIANLAAALCKFQANIGKVKKEATNPFFKSKYASLANILDVIQKPLADAGLSVCQLPDADCLTTILMHNSGEWIEATYCMPVVKTNDPQAMGSAITYAKRQCLGAVLLLNIDEDDDGEKAMQRTQPKKQEVPQEKPFINPAMVQWEKAVEHIKGGGAIEDILKKYQLKPEHLTILKAVK
jgi:hypothetical protein